MAEENKLAELAGIGIAQTPEEIKQQLAEKIQLEKEQLGGPTFFVNRHVVQTYPDSGLRITLGEQFSNDQEVPPVFRTAVWMHQSTAIRLAQSLIDVLPIDALQLRKAPSEEKSEPAPGTEPEKNG